MFAVHGTQGGLSGGPSGLEWKYFDPKKAPAQKQIRAPLPGPSYCREQLEMIEKSWKPNKQQQSSFSYMSNLFYSHLYKVLREDAQLQITPEQVRVQIGVIEECHRQNQMSKLKARGWTKGD